MKNRFYLIIIILLASFICLNAQNQHDKNDKFDSFIAKFYSDTTFQSERIKQPLKGVILNWHEDEDSVVETTWNNANIPILYDYESIKEKLPKTLLKWEQYGDTHIQTLYYKNSGFFLEREFNLIKDKWYLTRYKISNL